MNLRKQILLLSAALLLAGFSSPLQAQNPDLPPTLKGNWIDAKTNLWTLTFEPGFAVADTAFWDYASIAGNKKGTDYVVTLRDPQNPARLKGLGLTVVNDSTLTLSQGKSRTTLLRKNAAMATKGFASPDPSPFPSFQWGTDSMVVEGFLMDFASLGATPQQATVRYMIGKMFENGYNQQALQVDEQGRFRVVVPMWKNIQQAMVWDNWRIVSAGGRMMMAIPARGGRNLYMGTNARVNQELDAYNIYRITDRWLPRIQIGQTPAPESLEKWKDGMIARYQAAVRDSIPAFCREHNLSVKTEQLYKAFTLRAIASNFNQARYVFPELKTPDNFYWPSDGFDYENPMLFCTEDGVMNNLMVEGMFRKMNHYKADQAGGLSEYDFETLSDMGKYYRSDTARVNDFYRRNGKKLPALTKEENDSLMMRFFAATAAEYIQSSPNRDAAFADGLYWMWNAERRPLPATTLAWIDDFVRDPAIRQIIHASNERFAALIEMANKSVFNEETLPAAMMDADSILAAIVAPHRGKVIYLDIWGTWCSPCRAQMALVPAVKEALEGKDVVYIYLANGSPRDTWRSMIAEYRLFGSNTIHYNLPAQQQGAFDAKYLGRGYPTYILVDKEGKFVTKEAPWPAQKKELIQAIEELLAR